MHNGSRILHQQRFHDLIGREEVVEAHQRHCVLYTGVVSVKGHHVGNAHSSQLLEHYGAIQRLPIAAAVLIGGEEAAPEAASQEREAKVVSNSYTQIIDISGYVEPYDIQETKFRSTGAVTGDFVEEGDKVHKGDLLASIDNTQQLASLQEIRDQIEEAEISGSRRELELLRLREASAENALDYTNLYAAFDGEVASVDVSVEDYFEAGDSVITIVDRSRLKATVEIDEIDMQYVTEGQSAELVFEAAPNQTVHAYVSYIPMLGRYTDQGIGVVDVELLIEDPPAGIIPGFTFEGTLANESETTMLMVPQAAITRQRGGIETVDVREADGTSRKEEIRTQYLEEGLAEVLSGNLKEGDILVYPSSEDEHRAPMGGPPL